MLWNGAVTASVVLNKSGTLCAAPMVSQTGISDKNMADDYIAAARIAVGDAIALLGCTARSNDASIELASSQAVRRVAKSMFGLRPIAHVHVIRMGLGDVDSNAKDLFA